MSGWTTGKWARGVVEWVEGDTAYLSVVFSWDVDAAYSRACWYRQEGYKVRVGGPGVFVRGRELADVAEVGGSIPDTLARHNPMATKFSEGCPDRIAGAADDLARKIAAIRRAEAAGKIPMWIRP